jgi:alpha-glucosidase
MKHLSKLTKIRKALKPYIIDKVREGSEKGYPLQRPFFFHYEGDEKGYDIQDSYLFGDDILVAPVLEPNVSTRKVYLPDDEWVHFWTGVEYVGGEIEIECPVGYPPVFYRKASGYKEVFENAANMNRY